MTARALRLVEAEAIAYRRVWRGSIISEFVNPVLFLAAMGVGLGTLVDRGSGSADLSVSYVSFIASGLLAATAMQTGFGEGAWPVMAAIKWRKTYHAVIATPLSAADIVAGRTIWGVIHLAFTLTIYALVAAAFGALDPVPALLAVAPAVLCGSAFQAASTALTVSLEKEVGMTSAFRFVIMPLFLFSGTFFPISQLPGWLEALAIATPLWHGVELVRKTGLPGIDPALVSSVPAWVHVGYLGLMAGGSLAYASWKLRRRLMP